MKTHHLNLLGLVLFGALGCNNTSNPVVNPGGNTQTGSWVVPTKQTMYVYRIMTQALGSNAIATSFDTVVILDTGLARFGKTHVVEAFDGLKSTFNHYESNGDISQLDTSTPDKLWIVYPAGGGEPISDTPLDTSDHPHTFTHVADVRSFVAKESISLVGINYTSSLVREVGSKNVFDSSSATFDSTVSTTDYWFIPSIGTFGEVRILYTDHSTNYQSGSTSDFELVGYYPK